MNMIATRLQHLALCSLLASFIPRAAQANGPGQIIPATSMVQVVEQAQHFQPETIFFDLDDTLIRSTHMLGSAQWFDALLSELGKAPQMGQDPFQRAVTLSDRVLARSRMQPVEPSTVPQIHLLQQQRGVIGLTARGEALINTTLKSMHQLGMQLGPRSAGDKVDLEKGAYYQGGVIFAESGKNKRYALRAFLDRLQPSRRIMVVDDSRANLESLLKDPELSVTAIQYLGAKKVKSRYDHTVSTRQLELFQRDGQIPGDFRVRCLLSKHKARELCQRIKAWRSGSR